MTDLAPANWLYLFVLKNISKKKRGWGKGAKKVFGTTPSAFIFLLKYCLSTVLISYLAIYPTVLQKNVPQVLLQCASV